MSSELDYVVKQQRLRNLKAKVKAECLRRKYIGSVEEFGSSDWDFNDIPTTNRNIEAEQYRRLSIPARKINWEKLPNGPFKRVINDVDLLAFEVAISNFETRPIKSTAATDCHSSCTGTCTQSCTGDCSSNCGGSCATMCGGSCSNTCSYACYNSCYTSCMYDCEELCSSCYMSCSNKCVHSCYGSCDSYCDGRCTGECYNNCKHSCLTLSSW